MSVIVAALVLSLSQQAATPARPAQTPPASNLTRDLNTGPAGATPMPIRPPMSGGRVPIPTNPAPPPRTAPIGPANPATPLRTAPLVEPNSTSAPPPVAAATTTAPVRTTTATATTPAPTATTPPPAHAVPPPAPSVPAVTVLDAAARAALPFTVELPPGFQLVTGRPGPNFRIYTVRRGDRSYAMIYAGPSSQFPIYTGETVEAGGRASIVAVEGATRHAKEHLFQRQTDPREIHVWTMTLDGPDRALAERIAQSVDVR